MARPSSSHEFDGIYDDLDDDLIKTFQAELAVRNGKGGESFEPQWPYLSESGKAVPISRDYNGRTLPESIKVSRDFGINQTELARACGFPKQTATRLKESATPETLERVAITLAAVLLRRNKVLSGIDTLDELTSQRVVGEALNRSVNLINAHLGDAVRGYMAGVDAVRLVAFRENAHEAIEHMSLGALEHAVPVLRALLAQEGGRDESYAGLMSEIKM